MFSKLPPLACHTKNTKINKSKVNLRIDYYAKQAFLPQRRPLIKSGAKARSVLLFLIQVTPAALKMNAYQSASK